MAIELVCGSCQGRLLVETPGIVVACPHCGVHLQTPGAPEAAAPAAIPEPVVSTPEPVSAMTSAPSAMPEPQWQPAATEPEWPGTADANTSWMQPAESSPFAGSNLEPQPAAFPDFAAAESNAPTFMMNEPAAPEPAIQTTVPEPATLQVPAFQTAVVEPSAAQFPNFAEAAAATADAPAPEVQTVVSAPTSAPEQPAQEQYTAPASYTAAEGFVPSAATTGTADYPTYASTSTRSPAAGSVSPFLFKIMLSYASAATLACLFMGYMLFGGTKVNNNLESLPDLKPPQSNDKKKTVVMLNIPVDAKMPDGHTLKLGESRRFGSLKVTPVRVTRGPVEFVDFTGNKAVSRPPTPPVLKLYLKFENVSSDQEFPPLDRELVFTREPDRKKSSQFLANNFLCEASQKKKSGKRVLVLDEPPNSSWDLKGQNLNRELKPGESYETFVPTTEDGIDKLSGDLLWRVHFRKGYNRTSFRGVTTLVEVVFGSSEIENESAPAVSETTPAEKADKNS